MSKMDLKNEEIFTCSVCLQILEDPVTIGCGHSFCKKCINTFWDRKFAELAAFRCPQCRQIFTPRPPLKSNVLLAELLEEYKKRLEAVVDDEDSGSSDGMGDVLCDLCTRKRRSAFKFCLTCLVSYCQIHLKPHFEVLPLKKHKLIEATPHNKQNVCERHNKLREIHCRTDYMFLCALCVLEGHQRHDTVAVTEEMEKMQMKLDKTKQEVFDRIVDSDKKITQMNVVANSLKDTAREVCDEFEHFCMESIRVYTTAMGKKIADVREKVGENEKAGMDWINAELGKLKSEVNELNKRDMQLTKLCQTEEPIQFLKGCQAFGSLPAYCDNIRLEKLTDNVRNLKEKMKNVGVREKCKLYFKERLEISLPRKLGPVISRQYLVTKYKSHALDIDPNTIAACLSLSSSKRELSWGADDQAHPDHIDRFTYYPQALCKQGLTGDSYWEVEWDGGIVEVAVSYRKIQRKGSGNNCCFGHNILSWKIICCPSGCKFWHNNLERAVITRVSSNKLGVHLKYKEGLLRFYNVDSWNDELVLLHQSRAIFTEPLYPGFSIDLGSTLKIHSM